MSKKLPKPPEEWPIPVDKVGMEEWIEESNKYCFPCPVTVTAYFKPYDNYSPFKGDRPHDPRDTGDMFTIKEFKEMCESGGFIDSDGFGHFCTEDYICEGIEVRPSNILKYENGIPELATHVLWFNK